MILLRLKLLARISRELIEVQHPVVVPIQAIKEFAQACLSDAAVTRHTGELFEVDPAALVAVNKREVVADVR